MLKIYIGYSGEPEDGACLIFAHNAKEAKRIGYPVDKGWNWDSEFIDYRVTWLKKHDWLYKEADPVKLAADEAHVIDDPKSCKRCELWGAELDAEGICTDCREEEAFNKKLDENYGLTAKGNKGE